MADSRAPAPRDTDEERALVPVRPDQGSQLQPVDRPGDAEVVAIEEPVEGGPVDEQPLRTTWADITSRDPQDRPPIVPAWAHSASGWRNWLGWWLGFLWYALRFHTARSPKYALKVAVWAPVGLGRAAWRALLWVFDAEAHSLRQDAVRRNLHPEYVTLLRARNRRVKVRLTVAVVVLVVLAVGLVLLLVVAPGWAPWLALAAVLPVFAVVGRPADKPITDRVSSGPRFTKLTGEMVRTAVTRIGIPAIKAPGDIDFPPPGIHRDGPGWMARFNLPAGVEAVDVLEKRGRMSSALRLPVDQVWPTAGPEHAGQVDLWVGYAPSSQMGQPRWSLATPTARCSVFKPEPFGTDPRQRSLKIDLFARNFLIGGVPGSGKSYAGRTLVLIAALDPTAELKIAEFKGTADFGDLADLCTTYVCGVDEQALQEGADIIAWGLAEAERRGRRIRAARERGEAPEGKVTPELAAKRGSGLHPVVILIDEAHELFGWSKDAARDAERLIKRGRALGIIVILCTQIPDRTSLPPNITRCVTVRWCLAVQDQVANDMILGTGAYKRGLTATVYRPKVDAGWGIITGLDDSGPVRGFFDLKADAAIVARARVLRGGRPVGGPDIEATPVRDLLADLAEIAAGKPGRWWTTAAVELTERWPEAYPGATQETVSAAARAAGVASVDVKIDGTGRKGYRTDHITALITKREQ
jgi:S-DNA-T family DNA segregation ATPase FtsK/SpoIIIE